MIACDVLLVVMFYSGRASFISTDKYDVCCPYTVLLKPCPSTTYSKIQILCAMDLIVPTWRLFFLLSNRVSVILLPVLRRNAEVDVTWILILNNSLMKNIVFGRFQMGVFSPENKVRLCAAIFTALIFLDIIAFFDTLSPMLGFCKRQSASSVPLGLRHNYKGQSYDIETTNSSSQNYTKSMEYEMREAGEFHGEIVHDVAVLLVEVLGLAILLVANS